MKDKFLYAAMSVILILNYIWTNVCDNSSRLRPWYGKMEHMIWKELGIGYF